MNARHAKGLPFHVCALLTLVCVSVCGADPWSMGPGQFTTEVRGGKASAQGIFDDAGDQTGFGQGGTWEARQFSWNTELGWKRHTSVLLGVPLTSITRRYHALSDSVQTRTGLVDLSLGLKYAFFRSGPMALALTAVYEAPLGYDRWLGVGTRDAASGSDQVLGSPRLGAGHQNVRAMVEFGNTLPFVNSFFQVGGGMRFRVDGMNGAGEPQNELITYADYGWWPKRSILLAGSYRGRRENSEATNPQQEHVAGLRLLYRVDDSIDVYAESFRSIWGKNVRDLEQFNVGITAKKTTLNRLQGFFGTTKNP